MNDLVERLTTAQTVETTRPEKTAKALKESLDRDYVHVTFKNTGTELGLQIDKRDTNISEADFEAGSGLAHLVGFLTLNYEKVRCRADVDLATCEGTGYLEPVDEDEYFRVIQRK